MPRTFFKKKIHLKFLTRLWYDSKRKSFFTIALFQKLTKITKKTLWINPFIVKLQVSANIFCVKKDSISFLSIWLFPYDFLRQYILQHTSERPHLKDFLVLYETAEPKWCYFHDFSKHYSNVILTPFSPHTGFCLFQYSLKTQQTRGFLMFSVRKKEISDTKWVKMLSNIDIHVKFQP